MQSVQAAEATHLVNTRKDGELCNSLDHSWVIGEDVAHITAKHKEGHHDDQIEAGASSQTEVSCTK